MKQAMSVVVLGSSTLIIALGSSAQRIVAESSTITSETGITIGLAVGGIIFIAGGAFRIATWLTEEKQHGAEQDRRIAELENCSKSERE